MCGWPDELRGVRVQRGAVAPDLEAVWGSVEPRLRASLRAAGVAAADLDDLVQEVALRVLAHDVPFTSAEDLLRWCRLVGRRLAVDAHRRTIRSTLVDQVPDVAGTIDVEAAALARVRADRVLTALHHLDPNDRAAIIDLRSPDGDRREQVRLAVRRHRARARLTALVDGVAALLGWLVLRRRRPTHALAGLAMAPALTGFLLLPSATAPRTIDLPPAATSAPAVEAPVAPTLPAPSAPVLVDAAADDPVVEPPERARRRPVRTIGRRLREVARSQTVNVQLDPPVALPDLLPRTGAEVAGLAVELDL